MPLPTCASDRTSAGVTTPPCQNIGTAEAALFILKYVIVRIWPQGDEQSSLALMDGDVE
jgi:hypothetical protein